MFRTKIHIQEINDEEIKRYERYMDSPGLNREGIESAIQYVLKKIDGNLHTFIDQFPARHSINLVYLPLENIYWTPGFWTGMVWLAYEITGNDKYRRAAEVQLETYRDRLERKTHISTHDLGFIYSLSCVAAYKLTGNAEAKQLALSAAEHLSERFHEKPGMIQSTGSIDFTKRDMRVIVDNLMNLPLLYWAARETGIGRYYDIAYSHVQKAANFNVRPDASTSQVCFMDIFTGELIRQAGHQGYSDDSCWARGQAWGIYGFSLSYNYTGDERLIDITKKLANYFLNRLPKDEICGWDLIFTGNDDQRDTSAATPAVCGMLEMVRHLPLTEKSRNIYSNAALKIIKSLVENYTTDKHPESNGLLMHGVYSLPKNDGVDECCIWGDYFYFEALVRLLKDWKLYW